MILGCALETAFELRGAYSSARQEGPADAGVKVVIIDVPPAAARGVDAGCRPGAVARYAANIG
jgi:hypothetical protein